MFSLLRYFRWYHYVMIVVVGILVWIQVTCDLKLPDNLEGILKNILINAASPNAESKQNIQNHGLNMLLYTSISMACTIIVALLASRVASEFSNDIRKEVYKKVQSFSLEELEKFSTSSLITRSTNDVTQVQMVVIMVLRMAISAPMMATRAIIQIWGRSYQLSYVVMFAVIFLILFIMCVFIVVLPKFKQMQKLSDKLNLVTRENLTGLRVIRAYNASNIEEAKFEDANQEITKNNIFVNRVASLINPGMILTLNYTSLIIIWLGICLVNDASNNLEIQQVTSFQQYAMMVIIAFMQLTMIFIMVPRGSVSGKRINEVLKTKSTITNPVNKMEIENKTKGKIEFKDVSFSYPNALENVLSNISFTVNPGETVAFIGSTGSGKSTLINLIPRFFDTTSGSILVDGVDIRNYMQKSLREKIGYVPQKGVLFSGSIKSNLEFGKNDLTNEEIEEALDISCSKEFVSKFDEGVDYNISQGGKNVSGGQRQRLSIARAIVKKPDIYIFDDSFSALDYKTDLVVRQKLNEVTTNKTKLIVAQRIGTIIDANKIVVLEQGKICGIGTHKELLESCEVYQEIAYSQLSKEELLNE